MEQHRAALPVRLSAWILIGFLILPFLVIIPVSFTDQDYISMPKAAWSLQHYQELFEDAGWRAAFGRSALIASISTLLAVLIGSACAFGSWRLPPRQQGFIRVLVLLPLVVPTIIQGLAFYRTWVDLKLIDTVPGVVLAHAVTALPFVFVTVSASLTQVDPRLEMAARGLGATSARSMMWVLVPLTLPGMLSGALFAFAHSFDELIIVLFITSRSLETLPKRMWMTLEDDVTPVIACVAVLLGLLTLALLTAEWLLRSRKAGAAVEPVAAKEEMAQAPAH